MENSLSDIQGMQTHGHLAAAAIVLNLAKEAGIERIVYLSVIHSDVYVNMLHFAGKFGIERMIEQMGFNATILRPAYFMDNDLTIKDVICQMLILMDGIGTNTGRCVSVCELFFNATSTSFSVFVCIAISFTA